MRTSFVLELHGEWSEFADEHIGQWSQSRLLAWWIAKHKPTLH